MALESSFHRLVPPTEIHVVQSLEFADAAARAAYDASSDDIGRIARQTDDGTFWVLSDDSPLTWVAVFGVVGPQGPAIPLSSASPQPIGVAGTAGVSTDAPRADHVHAHGAQTSPTMHALATGGAHGFLSSSDFTKLAGIATGATNSPLSNISPLDVGDTDSPGSGSEASRTDHVHAHGTHSDPTFHATATTSFDGFLSSGDKVKLNGIATGAAAVSSSAPSDVTKSAANAGVGAAASRFDHKHDVSTGAPGTVTFGAAAEGSATSLARSDHSHALTAPSAPSDVTKSAASAGASANVARADHKHDISTAAPVNVGTGNAEGSATSLARSDHVHNVPFSAVQTALAAATSTVSVNNQNISGVLTPSAPDHAVPRSYVDTVATGLKPKESVDVVSTAPIALSGAQTIDGQSVTTGDFALVAGQGGDPTVAHINNGIYNVLTGAWTRRSDLAVGTSASGAFLFALDGAIYGDTGWVCTNTLGGGVVGTDALQFVQFSNSIALSNTAPVDVQRAAAQVGGSAVAARGDHRHDVSVGAPVTIGSANASGSASSLVRSDHVHDHGSQTVGSMHAVAVAAGANGFLSGSDKAKLDGVATGATNTPLASTAAAQIDAGDAAVVGVGTTAARDDHQHALNTGGAGDLVAVDAAAAASGSSLKIPRADHKHSVSTAAPVTIGSANAAGSATTLVLSDHVHDHGSQTTGTMHAVAIASGANGFLSGTDKAKLDGVASGAAALTSSAPADVTRAAAVVGVGTTAARFDHKHDISTAAPGATSVGAASSDGAATSLARSDHTHQSNTAPANVTKAAAAIGTSGEPARADHKHDISVGTPSAIGTANAAGTASSLVASDHVHDHGAQTTGTHHAVAIASGANGFLSGTDKAKLDGITTGSTQAQQQVFSVSGTWTCPANVTRLRLIGRPGAGGGGGGAGGTAGFTGATGGGGAGGHAGGGGGTATVVQTNIAVTAGVVYTVTVGAGGSAGTAGAANGAGGAGGVGGATQFLDGALAILVSWATGAATAVGGTGGAGGAAGTVGAVGAGGATGGGGGSGASYGFLSGGPGNGGSGGAGGGPSGATGSSGSGGSATASKYLATTSGTILAANSGAAGGVGAGGVVGGGGGGGSGGNTGGGDEIALFGQAASSGGAGGLAGAGSAGSATTASTGTAGAVGTAGTGGRGGGGGAGGGGGGAGVTAGGAGGAGAAGGVGSAGLLALEWDVGL